MSYTTMKNKRYNYYLTKDRPLKRKRKVSSESDDSDSEGGGGFPFPPALLPALLPGMAQKKTSSKISRNGNHIYFRDKVNMENINKLCSLINEANTEYKEFRNHENGFIIPKPLYVHICTTGGDLFAGFMAYDYMKSSNLPIYTVSEGHTISAGSLMFMAGKKRLMMPTSYMLIHQLRGGVSGTHAEIEDEFTNCESLMEKMKDIYLTNLNKVPGNRRTLLTDDDLESQLGRDIFWDFKTCYDKGLAHELYTNPHDRDEEDKKYMIKHSKDFLKYLE